MRHSRFLVVTLLFLFDGTRSAVAQQAASRSIIRARIVDELTRQTVPRVRFTFTGTALPDGVTGSSDARGELSVPDVPAGNYRLTLEKAGYFPEPVELRVGTGAVDLQDVVMTAKREISGIARWQDGEVAAQALVRVFGVRGGKPFARSDIPTSATNDRGEFVVPNLRPGRYILLVSPPVVTGGVDPLGRIVAGGVPRLGLPVYYPGVSSPDARASLDVRGALNVSNVGVVFEEKPGTVIEGTVVPSAGTPAGTNILLTLSNPGLFSFSLPTRAGDPFRLGPVPSGFYILDANSQGQSPGRALLSLTVGGTILRGVTMSMPPPAFLTGHVEIDDPAARPTVGVRIQSDRIGGVLGATASQSGEFRIAQVAAGEIYGLTVTSLPANAYLASVNQNGLELATTPFQVAAGAEPVRIVLKTDGGTIQGRAKQNAFVVLAPRDRRLQQSFRTVTANREGAYRLSAIPPGDYDLFALDRNEDDDYLDETFLQRFSDRAVYVKVQARSSASIDLH